MEQAQSMPILHPIPENHPRELEMLREFHSVARNFIRDRMVTYRHLMEQMNTHIARQNDLIDLQRGAMDLMLANNDHHSDADSEASTVLLDPVLSNGHAQPDLSSAHSEEVSEGSIPPAPNE